MVAFPLLLNRPFDAPGMVVATNSFTCLTPASCQISATTSLNLLGVNCTVFLPKNHPLIPRIFTSEAPVKSPLK